MWKIIKEFLKKIFVNNKSDIFQFIKDIYNKIVELIKNRKKK